MKNLKVFGVCILICITQPVSAQESIILDTDLGMDADDLGALVMLHNLVDAGECNLLAIMCVNNDRYAVPAIDAVNRYYDHPDIPIGTRKDSIHHQEWQYTRVLADSFPYQRTYENVPQTTPLYRKILSNQPDSSVTLITIGPLLNIKRLLESPADSISPLTGPELIAQKVQEMVIMGGKFPSGTNEWNFSAVGSGVTQFVMNHLPEIPIVFSGYEVGHAIRTGEVLNNIEKDHPLYVGFYHFSKHTPWVNERFDGKILDNASYDQTTVLYAVKGGVGSWWEKIRNGHVQVDSTGNNQWIEDPDSHQTYLKLTAPPDTVARLIEQIMLDQF